MASTISGFSNIEVGVSVPGEVPQGRNHSVADLIDIITEMRRDIDHLDVNTMLDFLGSIGNVSDHMANNNIHLTNATMKTDLVEIITKYKLGEFGSPTGGTGGGQSSHVVYSSRNALISATNPGTHGTLGYIQGEGANIYVWHGTERKWIVKSFNSYSPGLFPTTTDFIIPTGTVIVNSETGETYTWK